MLAISVIVVAVSFLIINVASVLLRNYRAHKFYQKYSPDLPVLPKPNILTGHALSVIISKKNWKIVEDLHKIHGPTFGYYVFEQPWVSTKDLDLIKLIEIDEAHKHTNRAFLGVPFSEFNNSIWHNEDDLWRHVRRLIAPSLTNHKIQSETISSDVESIANQLAASLERRAKRALQATDGSSSSFVLNMVDISERYTLAVIMLTTYGQFNVIDFNSERDGWVGDLNDAARQITNPSVLLAMTVPNFRSFCEWIQQFSALGKTNRKIVKFIEEATDLKRVAREKQVNRGMGKSSNIKDPLEDKSKRRFVDTFIEAFLDKKIKYDNFVGSFLFLLLAGYKTTSETISCLIWLLAKNPDIQEKLRRTILEEGIDSNYVVWCINEAIRYHPALPLGTGRVLGDDVKVNGLFLAKGTYVMPTTRGIHHDSGIWPEPERFKPERWRDQGDFHPAAFLGFGLGPRNCAGSKLAVHEIKRVVQMILINYDIGTCSATPDKWQFSSPAMVYTLGDEPIMIKFTMLDKQ